MIIKRRELARMIRLLSPKLQPGGSVQLIAQGNVLLMRLSPEAEAKLAALPDPGIVVPVSGDNGVYLGPFQPALLGP